MYHIPTLCHPRRFNIPRPKCYYRGVSYTYIRSHTRYFRTHLLSTAYWYITHLIFRYFLPNFLFVSIWETVMGSTRQSIVWVLKRPEPRNVPGMAPHREGRRVYVFAVRRNVLRMAPNNEGRRVCMFAVWYYMPSIIMSKRLDAAAVLGKNLRYVGWFGHVY